MPEDGVPSLFSRDAVPMEEARCFAPTMDGPAKLREPSAREPDAGSAEDETDREGGKEVSGGVAGAEDSGHHLSLIHI